MGRIRIGLIHQHEILEADGYETSGHPEGIERLILLIIWTLCSLNSERQFRVILAFFGLRLAFFAEVPASAAGVPRSPPPPG